MLHCYGSAIAFHFLPHGTREWLWNIPFIGLDYEAAGVLFALNTSVSKIHQAVGWCQYWLFRHWKDVSGKQISLSGTLHLLAAQDTSYGSYRLLKTPATKSYTLACQNPIASNAQRDQMAQETEPWMLQELKENTAAQSVTQLTYAEHNAKHFHGHASVAVAMKCTQPCHWCHASQPVGLNCTGPIIWLHHWGHRWMRTQCTVYRFSGDFECKWDHWLHPDWRHWGRRAAQTSVDWTAPGKIFLGFIT